MVDGVVDGEEQGEAEAGEQLGDDDGEPDGGKANYIVSGICFNSSCLGRYGHINCCAWYDLLANVDHELGVSLTSTVASSLSESDA